MTNQTRSTTKLILGTALAGASLMTAACAGRSSGPADTSYVARDVESLYGEAKRRLDSGQATLAAALFDEVERQHPYSPWARRAQLMSSFSYYVAKDYNKAIQSAQRFLQIHPGNKDAPYAFYLIALSYYEQISDVQRDQKVTEQALTALQEIDRRFPNSDYASDARLKIDLVRDHLAGKEMEIGRYYLRHKHYTSAINRFRVVVEDFQTTSHTPEALHRLVEAYLSLGLVDEAQTAGAILGHNYQSTEWYQDSYKLLTSQGLKMRDRGNNWLSQIYRQSIKGQWL